MVFACVRVFVAAGFILLFTGFILAEGSRRRVKGNVLVSEALPKIKVAIKGRFKYVGRFSFKIRDVAAGERFVFVDAEKGRVKRMFVAQFEGFLPQIKDFYRYSFANAMKFGLHKFRHGFYAYSNREARRSNPRGEGVLTEDFLKKRGYELENELMMSRFVTVTGKEKKHELILYYLENVSSSVHNLSEFYEDDKPTQVWKHISKNLKERSLRAFKVK